MPLESAPFIADLVPSNPPATDLLQQADDHIRLIKAAIQASFPNVVFARYLEQPREDVTDADDPDIWAATSDYVNLLGTTTTIGFVEGEEGQMKLVRFDGARILTHESTLLSLPGAANITTVAGDHALIRCRGATSNIVIAYYRASGKALIETDPTPSVTEADVGKAVILTNHNPKTLDFGYHTPPGAMVAWPTETVPAGWLELDGSAVSRTTYVRLFEVLGITYGSGDGSTTFNLPDMRGRFLRGWAHGTTVDPDKASRTTRGDVAATTGDHVGTRQADAFKLHGHTLRRNTGSGGTFNDTGDGGIVMTTNGGENNDAAFTGTPTDTAGQQLGGEGGNETRPVNINVMWIIKT